MVTGDRKKLLTYLKYTGSESIATLKDRKIAQKKIYLLQRIGLDLGYHFGWYIYGPYSPRLADDLYEAFDAQDTKDMPLEQEEKNCLDKLNSILSKLPEDQKDYWLELLASLDVVKKKELLKKLKPNKFKDEDIMRSEALLERYLRRT